jgi:hypothetical protein
MTHFKEVCKCGKVIMQCRCPGQKEIRVTDRCEHDWSQALVDELDEQYDVPASVEGNIVKKVEIDLPGRHYLDITNHNLYGFIVTLTICDETGGVIAEKDLLVGVKQENLASDVAGIYNSYE